MPKMDRWKDVKDNINIEQQYLENYEKKWFGNEKHIWNKNVIEEPVMQTPRNHISGYKKHNRANNSSMES
jgi:hypothetical protein